MKIAFLVLCHKNPKQINLMLDALNNEDVDFYIHIDKKSNIKNEITKRGNVYILSDDYRLDVKWGENQMVCATINLLKEAYKNNKYDYFWLISGQDFPIKSISSIKEYLEMNNGSNYIDIMSTEGKNYRKFLKRNELMYPKFLIQCGFFPSLLRKLYKIFTGGATRTLIFKRKNTTGLKFYFGSQWWTLTNECVTEMLDIINENIVNYYENCIIPDESFFQSVFMSTSFFNTRKDILTFLDWSDNGSHPKNLDINDYERLMSSEKMLARKFDSSIDSKILDKIFNGIKNHGE